MIRCFLAGRFLDDPGVGQVARPIRSQPDVVEANGFPCRDERPLPQDPRLDQGIEVSRLFDLTRQLRPIGIVGQMSRNRMCAQGGEGFGTTLVLSGMNTVTIPDDQVRTSTGLLVPSQKVAKLALAGPLVGVVKVDAYHSTGPPDARVKPNLQEATVFLLRDGRE